MEHLLTRISASYSQLSPQLQSIARYVERHCHSLALEGIQDVARHCGVQASAVVRFAQHFGYPGFAALRRSLRWTLPPQVRSASIGVQDNTESRTSGSLTGQDPGVAAARDFLSDATRGLRLLQRDLHMSALEDAVAALLRARSLWIVGTRQAFPVATYLAYAFQHGPLPVQHLSLLGGMQSGQLRGAGPGDIMLAVHFSVGVEETLAACRQALARGVRLIAMVDDAQTPLADHADVILRVESRRHLGLHGPINALVAAQALFLAYAHAQQENRKPP